MGICKGGGFEKLEEEKEWGKDDGKERKGLWIDAWRIKNRRKMKRKKRKEDL